MKRSDRTLNDMVITTPKFWDCECETDFIHVKEETLFCPICGAHEEEQPDSRVNEVLAYLEMKNEGKNLMGISQESAKRLLLMFMEETSESAYCAGWMDGLEFALWNVMCGAYDTYGMKTFDEVDRQIMRGLYNIAGGWYTFGEKGIEFISKAAWEAIEKW